MIGGLTGEQRFFLAFAQRWRKIAERSRAAPADRDRHPFAGRISKRYGAQCRCMVQSLRDRSRRQAVSEARRSGAEYGDAALHLWNGLKFCQPMTRSGASFKEPIAVGRPDILVTNELPFGPWIAHSPAFSEEEAQQSICAHDQGLQTLIDLELPAVISSRPVWNGKRLANEAFVLEQGVVRVLHHKQYFPNEPGWFEREWYAGDDSGFAVADILGIKVGVLLCTDAMFNERARAYGKEGASLVVIPRASGVDIESWKIAGAMASLVSGAYVVSSNRVGRSNNGTRFGGGGFAYEPHGRLLAVTTSSDPVKTLEVDPMLSAKARREYPCYVPEHE